MDKVNTQVEEHLVEAICQWVELAPPNHYGASSPLSGLWDLRYSLPYFWDGVDKLRKAIFEDTLFKPCNKQLTPAKFYVGGIETVQGLYNALFDCLQSQRVLDEKDNIERRLFGDIVDVSGNEIRDSTKHKPSSHCTDRKRPKR